MRRRVCLLLLVVAGCGRHDGSATKSIASSEPADPWVLTCLDPNAKEPVWLSNGQLGLRLGRDGSGAGQPFFAIDEYDTSGEEKIRTLPNPLCQRITLGGTVLTPENGTDYRQTLDMRTSALETAWRQNGARIDIITYLHPTMRRIVQRINVAGYDERGGSVFMFVSGGADSLKGSIGLCKYSLTRGGITMTESFSGLGGVGEFRVVDGGGEFHWRRNGASAIIYRVIDLSPSPNADAMRAARGLRVTPSLTYFGPPKPDFTTQIYRDVEKACRHIWARRWKTDIQIDGPVEDQQAVRSFLFYLQMAIDPKASMGVSPMALSNAQYGGHVFWDADIWVFPALALVNPAEAKAIPDYRLALADQARRNFAATLPKGGNGIDGLKYPWESSVSGKETVPGPSQKELHITGSVLWGLRQAEALGLAEPKAVDVAATTAAAYYRSIGTGGEIKGVMSPDENHIGDNDLYTNLLAQWLTGAKFKLPHDPKTFLTYDGDPLKGYKQAAAILSIYPLQYEPAEKQAKAMMDRFADKVTENGPAMSDSVDATIWARIGETDKAYDAWQKSWRDFTHNPLLLFSEKRKKPVTYFVTGAGGSLQSVLYGFLGFRLDSRPEPGSAWSMKLEGEHYLSVRPHLPVAWKSVKFTNFPVLGRRYTLTATQTGAKVSPGE